MSQVTSALSTNRRCETGEAAVPVRPAAGPCSESGREFRARVAALALSDFRSRAVGVGIIDANALGSILSPLLPRMFGPAFDASEWRGIGIMSPIIAGRLGARPSGRFGRSPAVASDARGVANSAAR